MNVIGFNDMIMNILVITGATDGIGKAYAEEVRLR